MFTDEQNESLYGGQNVTGYENRKGLDPLRGMKLSNDFTPAVQSESLDSEKASMLFSKLVSYYRHELDRQADNRYEMGLDENFYDGKQWMDEDIATLKKRGQTPLVYNLIASSVNWMTGTERHTRSDYKVIARRKEGDKDAMRKTELLKYLGDANRTSQALSRAFLDQVKAGVGWIESGVREAEDGEPIYDRHESWRNILFDSSANELDIKDARYMFRQRWTDLDVAASMFPGRIEILQQSVSSIHSYNRGLDSLGDDLMDYAEEEMSEHEFRVTDGHAWRRERLRLIEAWFRVPVEDTYMRGGQFSGELFDPSSQGHLAEWTEGRAQIIRQSRMRMHTAIFTDGGLLFLSRSPYRHNRFPFTPLWCYRASDNQLPYGMIRNMRDPQADLNKRASKALLHLSTNRVVMDEGTVSDIERFRTEAARPDAILIKKPHGEMRFESNRDLANAHLELMNLDSGMIQSISGITDENLGRSSNATSGRAIQARQDQGTMTTAAVFDHLKDARQTHGEKMISLVEQYMKEEKQFRLTDSRGNPTYTQVNDGLPDNDITRHKADFIISEDAFKAATRMMQLEALMSVLSELAKTAPEVIGATLDLIVDMMDIPYREEIVRRIRQITGMQDPDADPNNPDPETLARQEKEAEMEALEMRGKVAEISKIEGEAARSNMTAEKMRSEIERILSETAGRNVETQAAALLAALDLMQNPVAGDTADKLLSAAGYDVQTQKSMGAPPPPPPPPEPNLPPPPPPTA